MSTRAFTPEELAVLEALCAGDWPGAEIARVQLASAVHAGHPHPMADEKDNDACFEIQVAEGAPRLEMAGHQHMTSLSVFEGDEPRGEIDLGMTDGALSDFEYHWYTDDPPRVPPRLDQLRCAEYVQAYNAGLRR